MTVRPLHCTKYINLHTHHIKNSRMILHVFNLLPEGNLKIPDFEYVSAGIHPWHIDGWQEKLHWVEKNLTSLIAIGEIGLDKACETPLSIQKTVFEQQLQLAIKHNKPVIIHCVKAFSEILKLKKEEFKDQVWVMHGFNANQQVMQQLLSAGCCFSFGKMLLVNGSKAQYAFKALPIENVFFETDDDPALNIQEVYEMGASLKKIDVTELKDRIYHNFTRLFKIK